MINIRTIRKLSNNDGLTLKRGKIIVYKTGSRLLPKVSKRAMHAKRLTQ